MDLDPNILNPSVAVTVRCPACNEVVLYEREQCPYCGIKLDKQKLRADAINTLKHDRAISSANTIRTFNPGAVLFLIVAVINPFLSATDLPIRFDFYFTYVCLGALFIVGTWFWTHGRLSSQEPDYLSAKQAMKKSFLLWLTVNVVNLTLLIVGKSLLK